MEQPPVQAQINECTEIAFLYETNIDFVLRGQGFLENDKISLRNERVLNFVRNFRSVRSFKHQYISIKTKGVLDTYILYTYYG